MTWQEPFNFHFDPFLLLMDHYGITTRPKALSKVAVPGIEGSPVDCRCPEQVLFHNSRYFQQLRAAKLDLVIRDNTYLSQLCSGNV